MRFGINSLLFTDTFDEGDLPLLERCRELGFDVLEITPVDPDRFPARRVRQLADTLDISVNVNFALPQKANTLSPDPEVRRRGVELSKKIVDLCSEAGAEIYCGANYCTWKYFTGRRRTEDEWRWAVDCYRQLAEYTRENSELLLAIETLNRFETYFLNLASDALRFVEDVGMPNVKVHLDTFHMLQEEDDLGAAIRACGDRLGYFHACGSQRGIPGRDMVPWRETLAALRDSGYQDCITIESFHPRLKFAPLVSIWRDFADSPEELATEGLAFLREVYRDVYGETPDSRAPQQADRLAEPREGS
jgi:D-psicose/D-tagatose/L-ribulose 3-epimerase